MYCGDEVTTFFDLRNVVCVDEIWIVNFQ